MFPDPPMEDSNPLRVLRAADRTNSAMSALYNPLFKGNQSEALLASKIMDFLERCGKDVYKACYCSSLDFSTSADPVTCMSACFNADFRDRMSSAFMRLSPRQLAAELARSKHNYKSAASEASENRRVRTVVMQNMLDYVAKGHADAGGLYRVVRTEAWALGMEYASRPTQSSKTFAKLLGVSRASLTEGGVALDEIGAVVVPVFGARLVSHCKDGSLVSCSACGMYTNEWTVCEECGDAVLCGCCGEHDCRVEPYMEELAELCVRRDSATPCSWMPTGTYARTPLPTLASFAFTPFVNTAFNGLPPHVQVTLTLQTLMLSVCIEGRKGGKRRPVREARVPATPSERLSVVLDSLNPGLAEKRRRRKQKKRAEKEEAVAQSAPADEACEPGSPTHPSYTECDVCEPEEEQSAPDGVGEQAAAEAPECKVCLADLFRGEPVSALECGHLLHSQCAEKVASVFSKCPVCTRSLYSKPMRVFA